MSDEKVASSQGKRCMSYLRVSSKGQIEGHGFDRQRDIIADYARRAGYEITGEYQDAYTGTDADRPAFLEMLEAMLDNGVRTVIVESLDRFARSLGVQIALLAKLQANGISLISAATGENVTDEPDEMREAMILIQGVFNQLQKKRLVKKMGLVRKAMRAAGKRCEGRLPFGTYPDEADALERILAMHRTGKQPGAIAKAMNAAGVRTRSGRPWIRQVVGPIIRRAEMATSKSI